MIINIFTSIAPFQIEKQLAAISTWIDLGCIVHSVNSQKEIELLCSHFSKVNFHQTERSGLALYGKPYVFLDEVFTTAQRILSNQDVFVLCNSDIFLDHRFFDPSVFSLGIREIILATRFNVPALNDISTGLDYDCGIDLFAVRVSELTNFDMGEFCLGVPFWDFWFPMQAVIHNFSVRKLNYPLAVHVMHPENYSHANFQKSGISYLQGLVSLRPEFLPLLNRLIASHNLPAFDEMLINEIIAPTIALLHHRIVPVSWPHNLENDTSMKDALSCFNIKKHSKSLPTLPLMMQLFDVMEQPTGSYQYIQDAIVNDFDYYPFYTCFYNRFANAFQALHKSNRVKAISRTLSEVNKTILLFFRLGRT